MANHHGGDSRRAEAECVRATFFLIGENARARPALVKREMAEGHTVAHHSMTHPAATLAKLPHAEAVAEIDRGIAADDMAAYGKRRRGSPRALLPLPRLRLHPGAAGRPLPARHLGVWRGSVASDWNRMEPAQQLELVLGRLEAAGRGIILFHDTKPQTAAMIPLPARAQNARLQGGAHRSGRRRGQIGKALKRQWRPEGRHCRSTFPKSGADERTRTSTGLPTSTSS